MTEMNRIKEVLEENGITQTWLAEQLGKSYNMVNSYVQNRQQPRLEILFEIAKILQVSAKDLLVDQPIEDKSHWKSVNDNRRISDCTIMKMDVSSLSLTEEKWKVFAVPLMLNTELEFNTIWFNGNTIWWLFDKRIGRDYRSR